MENDIISDAIQEWWKIRKSRKDISGFLLFKVKGKSYS